jgi:hypothetical protein
MLGIATAASLAEAQRAIRPAYTVRTRRQHEPGADFTLLGIAIQLSKVTRRPAMAECQNSALVLVAARHLIIASDAWKMMHPRLVKRDRRVRRREKNQESKEL